MRKGWKPAARVLALLCAVALLASSGHAEGGAVQFVSSPSSGQPNDVEITVAPSLIQAELGSFLWIAQTEVGTITVRNTGRLPVTVVGEFRDAVQDLWGTVAAGHTDMCSSLLRVEPASLMVAPGASGSMRIRAHPSVALEKKSGVAAVLSVTARPASRGLSAGVGLGPGLGTAVGTRVCVPVLVKPAGMRRTGSGQTWLAAKAIGYGPEGVWLDVRNVGPVYAWVSGKVEVRWAEERASIPVPLSLVLPGCTRRLVLEGWADLSLPEGEHEVVVRLQGEQPTTFALNFATEASPGRP
ncbi:MAG: hypothetical protein WBK10_02320 [Bacillota bacterium]|jgi:P pilus assembly chaperone PapD|nr:hypothetical protein [Bacillota bacterium]